MCCINNSAGSHDQTWLKSICQTTDSEVQESLCFILYTNPSPTTSGVFQASPYQTRWSWPLFLRIRIISSLSCLQYEFHIPKRSVGVNLIKQGSNQRARSLWSSTLRPSQVSICLLLRIVFRRVPLIFPITTFFTTYWYNVRALEHTCALLTRDRLR